MGQSLEHLLSWLSMFEGTLIDAIGELGLLLVLFNHNLKQQVCCGHEDQGNRPQLFKEWITFYPLNKP